MRSFLKIVLASVTCVRQTLQCSKTRIFINIYDFCIFTNIYDFSISLMTPVLLTNVQTHLASTKAYLRTTQKSQWMYISINNLSAKDEMHLGMI